MRVQFELSEDQLHLFAYMRESLMHRVNVLGIGRMTYMTKNDITYIQDNSTLKLSTFPELAKAYLEYSGARDGTGITSIARDLLNELFPASIFIDPMQYDVDPSEKEYNSIRWDETTVYYMASRASTGERLSLILTYMLHRPAHLAESYSICINKLGPENTARIEKLTKLYNEADQVIATLDQNEPAKGTANCYRNQEPKSVLGDVAKQKSILTQMVTQSVAERLNQPH